MSAREALVDAALVEFSEHGYEATTVAAIAARAGVTTGALYAHFASKLELLVAAIGLGHPSEYAAVLSRAYSTPVDRLVAALEDQLPTSTARRLLLLDAIVLARRDPEVADMLRLGFDAYLGAMAGAIQEGVDAGVLDPVLPSGELARLGAAVSLGNLVLEVLGEQPPERRALAELTEVVMRWGAASVDDGAALGRVRARAGAVEDAIRRLHDAIQGAAADGHSLRRIGDAAGLSHEQVRRLLSIRQKM